MQLIHIHCSSIHDRHCHGVQCDLVRGEFEMEWYCPICDEVGVREDRMHKLYEPKTGNYITFELQGPVIFHGYGKRNNNLSSGPGSSESHQLSSRPTHGEGESATHRIGAGATQFTSKLSYGIRENEIISNGGKL